MKLAWLMGFDVGYCDLEISGRILKNDSLRYDEVPYSSVSHWSAVTEPRFHHFGENASGQYDRLEPCYSDGEQSVSECKSQGLFSGFHLLHQTGFGDLQAGCKAGLLASTHEASQCSGRGCSLYAVTTGNWSAGVRVSVAYCFPQRVKAVTTQWAINEMT